MNKETRDISLFVAYKGVIELIKTGKADTSDLESEVRSHFEILQRLSETEITERQKTYLAELMDNCNAEEAQYRHFRLLLSRAKTYSDYEELRDKLLEFQIQTGMNMKEVCKEVERKVAQKNS